MSLAETLRRQPRSLLLMEAVLLVLGIGLVDFRTGYEVSVYVFYSIPILLVVWFVGRNAGLGISVFSAVVWSVADIAGRSYEFNLERLWNMTVQLTFFVFIVLGGAALKGQRDQSRARAALLERFHTLAQISPVGIFRLGLAGSLVYVNERWRRIAGVEETDSLPASWAEAFHPDDRERVSAEWERATREQRQCEFEARFRHASGLTVWVLGQVAPERNETGGVAGYVGAITDMTELRRLEREVLEISEREQQRIGQDLHDDLCQHLVAIQYSAASLKRIVSTSDASMAAASASLVELLKEAVVRTRQMARRIFPVNLDQAGLMSALRELAQNSSRFFDVACSFECPLPVLLEDNATGVHLFRIAQEALSNAVRHAQPSEVKMTLAMEGDRVVLIVRDNGVGIPVMPVDSTGMGLHIMNYRARMIGATLQVERLPEGGTEVRCTLRQAGKRLRELVAAGETRLPLYAS